MPQELSNNSNILIELSKAVKMHNFYPEGHPHLDSALEKCYLLLKKELAVQDRINWKIDQKGFYEQNKTPLAPGNQEIAALAKKVFYKRIKELSFTSALTIKDMKVFLSVIKLEPEELQAKGGFEAVFADNDVAGLEVNGFGYEDLQKLKKELAEKREQEAQLAEERKKKEAKEAGESAKNKNEENSPEKQREEEEPLATLLERIRHEADFLKYNDLSVRIVERCENLLFDKRFADVFPVLLIFSEHSSGFSLQADIKTIAQERLTSLFNVDILKYLVTRLADKNEELRQPIQNILLHGGEDAVELLLNQILDTQESVSRRYVFNTIIMFGSRIRPLVERRLKSPQWFAVRQMIAILGEFADPNSFDALEDAYNKNSDVRIKKEVLKSLVKIPSTKSTEMLIAALGEEDQSLVNQAIISLGMLRDSSAIENISKIALKSHLSENLESKKEAIRALGIIGDQRAVPDLIKILSRKVWFGRKTNEELRSLAAYSLGMIGGEEAYHALEKTRTKSAGELYTACKKILEGREKNI